MTYTYDDKIDKRKEYGLMRGKMVLERASFESHWMELANYVKPRRTRFFSTERNRGEKRNHKIIDSTATYCHDILRSGMHSGLTSPASPWLEMGLSDPDLQNYAPVKNWLKAVTERLLLIFEKSNLYNVLPVVYGDEGLFGTAAMGLMEDSQDIIRSYSYPMGSYYAGMDARGMVSTFMRDSQFTTRQIVKEFGVIPGTRDIDWSNISDKVKDCWDKGDYDEWHDLCWVVSPNDDFDERRYNAKYKKFASCWFEVGGRAQDKFLRESGYDEFPVFVPRWETTGEDTYGTSSPGMMTLGDIKQLQVGEKRSLQAIEKMINPPLEAPSSMRNTGVSTLPGGISYNEVAGQGRGGIRSIFEVNFRIDQMEQKQEQVRKRLHQGWYTDLFLMMASTDRREITAREVAERHEEKLLALGPVVEGNDDDLLNRLVFRTFAIANRAGLIPPPPQQIQGKEFTVTYVSLMHQAQKLVSVSGHERFMGGIVNLSEFFPEIKAKVNIFKVVDVYGDMLSVDPRMLRSDDEAQAIIDQQNKMAAAQQAAETAKTGASAVKDLANSPVGGPNAGDTALTQLIGQRF